MKSTVISRLTRPMSKSKKASEPVSFKPQSAVSSDKDGNVVIQILAKPGAKSNSITGIEEERVAVQIKAKPIDGEANTELVKYVMSVLGLKKNEISLEKGMKSRQKTLSISNKSFTPEKVIEKFREEMES